MRNLRGTTCLVLTLMLILAGCSETATGPGEEGEDGDDSNSPSLEAVIDYSPENPETDSEVTLDASKSEDDQDIGYQIEWSLDSIPSGSGASLSSATNTESTFTPDVAGDYTVTLTISNDSEGVESTAETTISAMDPSQTQEISGDINADRTLENINDDPSTPDYLVTGNLNVYAGLTIEPGVVMHFQENVQMYISSDGTLLAKGTQADSIKFTSSNREGELYWKGIFVKSGTSQNTMEYVEVSYAGKEAIDFAGENYATGVGIGQSGQLSIKNSTFSNNKGFGVYLDEEGQLNQFASNSFSGNDTGVGINANEVADVDGNTTFVDNNDAAVLIFGTSLTSDQEATWNALAGGASYTVNGNLSIDGTLTIAPGAKFEMAENVLWHINGALIADGTDANNISFTTSDVSSSLYWKGLFFTSADSRNELNFVNLLYGGNEAMDFAGDNYATTVGVGQGAKLSVSNSSISNSKGYGLYLDEEGQLSGFASNSFSGNLAAVSIPANEVDDIDSNTTFSDNTEAEVEIVATTYTDDKSSAWQPLSGSASYRITGNVYVNGDLTIAAGANFELDENVLVQVNGSLSAEGTSDNMIEFTTSNLSGQLYWKGLYITSSSALNKLDYVKVSYAGNSAINFAGDNYQAAVGIGQGAKLTVTNSELSNNLGFGLYADEEGQISGFSSNTIADNQAGVGIPANEADDMDFNTSFSNNADGAVNIFGTTLSSSKEVTWKGLAGDATYVVLGNLGIDGVLTLGQGAHFENNEDVQWYVSGALISRGEPGNEVVLTTSNIEGGLLWRGLFFVSSDSRNALYYTKVSYGGKTAHDFSGENFKANIGVNTDAQLTVENSTISYGAGYGVYAKGTVNAIESLSASNTFSNNSLGNVF